MQPVLGNFCQCVILLTVKKCFLLFKGNLLCFSLCLLLYFYIRGKLLLKEYDAYQIDHGKKKSRSILIILEDLCSTERLPEKKATDLSYQHDNLHLI